MEAPVVTGLYVPGDRPERFAKAVATGAQLVILDLEDAVAPDHKEEARRHVADWLSSDDTKPPLVEVRVNSGSVADLKVLAELRPDGVGVRLPKVESQGAVEAALAALGYTPRLAAVIETAAGVEALSAIASHPAVRTLSLGEADLASDLGTADSAALDWARVRLLVAARAHGKPAPMMSIYPDIRDLDGLAADTRRGKAMGFVGRTAVHPSQVPVIAAAFVPTADEVSWATEVLAATATGGVATLASGEMVDPAMRRRAETILALAAATRDLGGHRVKKPAVSRPVHS
jgi:citrate lyase subunit beta/citryl-CoA lyase